MRTSIAFLHGQEPRRIEGVAPSTTVLEWLRGGERACGTKEGCAEGDCGACTVVLGEPAGGGVRYRPVNACILFVTALDGRQLLTIEHLAADGVLHPVQRAMVDAHASQCGFCTPGIIMSLWALRQSGGPASRSEAAEALAGNLCRCTGYRPILDAAMQTPPVSAAEMAPVSFDSLPDTSLCLQAAGQRHDAPRSLAEAVTLLAERPRALLLAGGTDLALRVTKGREVLDDIIMLDRVSELLHVTEDADGLRIGAAVSYDDAMPVLLRAWPELGGMLRRLGSRQIRARGTIGGNLGTASPIGDMAPALIALGATVEIASAAGRRVMPVENFFTGYRRHALAPGELIAAVRVPRREPDDVLRVYKVTKRAEEDISAVCAAFRLRLRDGVVERMRCGFGGVAATPVRATALEEAIAGRSWSEATLAQAGAVLGAAIRPIDDMRASAAYRRLVAVNLLRRLYLETTRPDIATRVGGALAA